VGGICQEGNKKSERGLVQRALGLLWRSWRSFRLPALLRGTTQRGREFFLRLLVASQTLLFGLVSRGPCDESRCLLFDDEMNAPVLLHTVVTVLETDGTILSIARRVEVD